MGFAWLFIQPDSTDIRIFFVLHFFRIFLFGGLTVLASDPVIIGFDQARFSSCLKIH